MRGRLRRKPQLEELVKGLVGDVAELAARENRTARSIRLTLSLAFLDPALIDAACTGTLPRGYGVTRLMDLPARFADQWRALGLTRPVIALLQLNHPSRAASLGLATGRA